MTTDELRKLALAATTDTESGDALDAMLDLVTPERILAMLDIIEEYASHHNWCAGNDCGKCTCGKDAALEKLKVQ